MNIEATRHMSQSDSTTRHSGWLTRLLLLCLLAGFGLPSMAQSPDSNVAGRVIMVFGKVLLVPAEGAKRLIKRGDLLRSGDRVVTQGSGYAQVRYRDGALMSIRPGTDFRIDEFHFEGRQDGRERSFFSVLKGGLRTITGLIGKKNKLNYRVSTPIATIGIRGTHYGMRLCGVGDCVPGEPPGGDNEAEQAADPGLYVEVKQGATAVTNSAGEQVYGAGQNYYVANQSANPKGQLAPFGFVFDKYTASEDQNEGEAAQEEAPPAGESEGQQEKADNGQTENEGADQNQSNEEQADQEDGGTELSEGDQPLEADEGADAPDQATDPAADGEAATGDEASQAAPNELSTGTASSSTPGQNETTASTDTSTSTTNTVAEQSTVNNDETTAVKATEVSNTRSATNGSIGFLALTPDDSTGVVAGGRHDDDAYKLLIGTEAAGAGQDAILQAQAIRSDADGGQFKAESATLAELGALSGIIHWGRWVNGWEAKGAQDSAFSTGVGNAHFIYSEQATSDAQLTALSGEATFYLRPSTGSTPTHVDGRSGSLDHAAMVVDFSSGQVTGLRIDVSVDNDRFSANNTASLSLASAMFDGMPLVGECLGCSGGELALEGNAKLGFVNDASTADLAILAFGLGSADLSEGVLGTAVLDLLSQSDGGTGSVALMAFEVDTAGNTAVNQFHTVRLADDGANEIIETTTIDAAGNIVTRLAAPDGSSDTDEWRAELAKLEDTGGDTIGINWGRWDDDWRYLRNGTAYKPKGGAHFAYTDKATSSAELAAVAPTIGGMATFNHIGGTAPTSGDGSSGSINSWQFDVDFGSASFDVSGYQFSATVNGRTMNISQTGSMAYSQTLTDNIQLSGTCTGGCGGSVANGEASLQLVGAQATHAISAVTARDSTNTTAVSAVGAFSR